MAGGKLAAEVVCMVCLDDRVLTRAVRVYEGDETDRYRCAEGHEFGLDWNDPATEPQWPAPPEILAGLPAEAAPLRSQQPIKFRETDDARYPYTAIVAGTTWSVRINEFPEEPSLYSLIIDGDVVEELMEWPDAWTRLVKGAETSARPVDPDDAHERAEFERERAHAERISSVPPSKLVK